MGKREQPPRFGMLRPEGDDLAEADDRFVTRFWLFSRMPRFVYASECSGSASMAARKAASDSASLPCALSTTPRLLCAFA
jgi:hypothetical protein